MIRQRRVPGHIISKPICILFLFHHWHIFLSVYRQKLHNNLFAKLWPVLCPHNTIYSLIVVLRQQISRKIYKIYIHHLLIWCLMTYSELNSEKVQFRVGIGNQHCYPQKLKSNIFGTAALKRPIEWRQNFKIHWF